MKLLISGMHCAACVNRVQKALEKVDGVTVHRVEVGSAEVDADSSLEPAVIAAVQNAGFEARKA